MQVLDLFSGIGGFSIGLEKAGFETVAFCEIEPYCQDVLRKHWPDTPIYNDVRSLTGEQLRADGIVPDVIVGGYPCQPFSVAGHQRGEKDERHLWPEVHRLIREVRPRWVICENVSGHIKLGLDEVLSTLEAEGYTVWPFIIPACGVDAPHKRDRIWIVAHANSQGQSDGSEYEQRVARDENVGNAAGGKRYRDNGRRSGERQQSSPVGLTRSSKAKSSNVGNAEYNGSSSAEVGGKPKEAGGRPPQGAGQAKQPSGAGGREDDEAVADSTDERPQGRTEEPVYGFGHLSQQSERGGTDFGSGWPVEPNVGRVANGVPARSHRIKALGNAVVPQIPEVIGKVIMEYENA